MKQYSLRLALLALFAGLVITCGAISGRADDSRHRIVNQATPGQPVDIAKFVVAGKVNIFDFYSKFCPPCMRMSPLLEKLAEKNSGVVVNKIDINRPDVQGIDWQSPVARQFKLESIPHFMVFDEQGKKIAEGEEAYKKVISMLQSAGVKE